MNKSVRVPACYLDFYNHDIDLCVVDSIKDRYLPDDLADLIHGGIDDKAKEFFHSPLYELGKELEKRQPINELVLYGDEHILDFKWLWAIYEYDAINCRRFSIDSLFDTHGKRILRIENELEELISIDPWRFTKDEGSAGYFCYINNYVENVEINGVDKDKLDHFFYLAPKENTKPVDGCLLELTLAPRETFLNDKRWIAPVTIDAHSVSCVMPELMPCYETEKHEGCRLVLLGENMDKDVIDTYRRYERWPEIVVWESYDFVVNKLKQAGWNK